MSDRRAPILLSRQLQHAMPLAVVWMVGLVVLWIASLQDAASLEELFLDPATLAGQPWYQGLLANLGTKVGRSVLWPRAVAPGFRCEPGAQQRLPSLGRPR
jgi:hypothetical protein